MVKNINLVKMFGYTLGEYLMAKTTLSPDFGMMMTGATPKVVDPAAEDEAKADDICQAIDMSHQGLKRAVAKAVARTLGIQPGIKRHFRLLLQIGQLLGCCSYKATHSIQCYSHLGHRRKTMPYIQGG
jgi:hypothetical protein